MPRAILRNTEDFGRKIRGCCCTVNGRWTCQGRIDADFRAAGAKRAAGMPVVRVQSPRVSIPTIPAESAILRRLSSFAPIFAISSHSFVLLTIPQPSSKTAIRWQALASAISISEHSSVQTMQPPLSITSRASCSGVIPIITLVGNRLKSGLRRRLLPLKRSAPIIAQGIARND